MRMYVWMWSLCAFLAGCWGNAHAQNALQDSVKYRGKPLLLNDIAMRIEATDALNAMYNFDFYTSDRQFRWFQYKHPGHPMPYFLLGLNEWWKIMPNPDEEVYDETFFRYMDSTIYWAEKLYDEDDKNPEAVFFLAAAHGFKGRLLADRKAWTKGALAAKSAMRYMSEAKKLGDFGIEFQFGDALYNYYSVWVPENYRALRPVMLLFPKGDKAKGLAQLKEVAHESFYTRVEAQYFLIRIYSNEESNKADLAYPYAEYLHKTFPNNPYFHRTFARLAYTTGNWSGAETACRRILNRLDSGWVGYESVSGRYASFMLGHILMSRQKWPEAKGYLLRCLAFAEQNKAYDSGYYLYALAYLARQADKESDKASTQSYYQKISEYAEKKSALRKEAEAWLKKNAPKKRGLFGLW